MDSSLTPQQVAQLDQVATSLRNKMDRATARTGAVPAEEGLGSYAVQRMLEADPEYTMNCSHVVDASMEQRFIEVFYHDGWSSVGCGPCTVALMLAQEGVVEKQCHRCDAFLSDDGSMQASVVRIENVIFLTELCDSCRSKMKDV